MIGMNSDADGDVRERREPRVRTDAGPVAEGRQQDDGRGRSLSNSR